jgi:CBS domain-containing protein
MSIETIPVSDIMVRNVKTAEENQSIHAIAKVMSENNIGSVVILKSNEVEGLSGIITERDIVRIAGAAQISSSILQLIARDVMSKPVITIDAASSIQDAIQSMKLNNIRRLPVVDREGKKMVGIITDKDIFRAIINSQSLAASISENVAIEYRPMYERLNEFVLGEMLLPGDSSHN